jgi:hypothetical protein
MYDHENKNGKYINVPKKMAESTGRFPPAPIDHTAPNAVKAM